MVTQSMEMKVFKTVLAQPTGPTGRQTDLPSDWLNYGVLIPGKLTNIQTS